MYVVPIPTQDFLQYAVQAARHSKYAVLAVILARTAEAREQHEELVRDWTSLHDITGPLIAVLCPDPRGSESEVLCRDHHGNAVVVPGLVMGHPADRDKANFEDNMWNPHFGSVFRNASQDFEIASGNAGRESRLGFTSPKAPDKPKQHKFAWTEATSRCASYFGISEGLLPGVLFLDLWGDAAVLICLEPGVSLYGLCKRVIVSLDEGPTGSLSLWLEEEKRLEYEISQLQMRYRSFPRPAERVWQDWCAQVRSLESHLWDLGVDDDHLARCRSGLQQVLNGQFPAGLAQMLRDVDELMPHDGTASIESRARAKLRRVVKKLENGSYPRPAPPTSPPMELQQLKANLGDVRDRLAQLRNSSRISQAVLSSVEEAMGDRDVSSWPMAGDFVGWNLHVSKPKKRKSYSIDYGLG